MQGIQRSARAACVCIYLFVLGCGPDPVTLDKPNILFIAVDDWKPLAGTYGDPIIQTPSIDALARQGRVFHHAYAQHPVCGVSRTSMLTGLRPESNGVFRLQIRLRDVNPDIVTMPQFFKNAGYVTAASGKVFDPRNVDSRDDDDPQSWSIPFKASNGKVDNMTEPKFVAKPIDAPTGEFIDGQILVRGVELLRQMARGDRPFFLAVGFQKPHLPFVVPTEFFDLYEQESFPLANFQQAPLDSDPSYVLGVNKELRSYWPTPLGEEQAGPYGEQINPAQQQEIIRGYYASVSFIDHLIGQLLDELESLGEASNTIVVLWGDSGFHLGDHGQWGKRTAMEQASRIPMVIKVPGIEPGETFALVESLDLFPTLAELAGLDAPPDLHGLSLAPVLNDRLTTVKDVAISQFNRLGAYAYSMRTDQYRYTEWVEVDGAVVYRELYDLRADPEESVNIGGNGENSVLMDALANQLRSNSTGLLRLR
jgi:iduronate 2-sulfatase